MTVFGVPGDNTNPLAYADRRLAVVAAIQAPRRPTTSDTNFPLWTEWRVTKDAAAPAVEGEFWKLVAFAGAGLAQWVQLNSTPGTGIDTLTGDSGGPVGPDVSANVNLLGGTNITVTGAPGSNTLTIDSSAGTFPWTEVTGTSQMMAVNNGYIANNAAQVDCTLPTTSSVGDIVEVVGKGAGGFKVSQTGAQQIAFLGQTTTAGVGGTLTPDEAGASVKLLCITATNLWRVIHSVGNFVLV
jgi:hypothetical protein